MIFTQILMIEDALPSPDNRDFAVLFFIYSNLFSLPDCCNQFCVTMCRQKIQLAIWQLTFCQMLTISGRKQQYKINLYFMYSIDLHALTESGIMVLISPIIWHYTCEIGNTY